MSGKFILQPTHDPIWFIQLNLFRHSFRINWFEIVYLSQIGLCFFPHSTNPFPNLRKWKINLISYANRIFISFFCQNSWLYSNINLQFSHIIRCYPSDRRNNGNIELEWDAANAFGQVYSVTDDGDLSMPGMNTNACGYTACPIQSSTRQTYSYTLPLAKKFPPVS